MNGLEGSLDMFKLLKYHLKSFLKIHILLTVVIFVNMFMLKILNEIAKSSNSLVFRTITGFLQVIFIITIITLVIFTVFLSIRLFYQKVLSDQGYLTNTLPLKPSSIINSITLNAIIYLVYDFFVILVVFLLYSNVFIDNQNLDFSKIPIYLLLFLSLTLTFTYFALLILSYGFSRNNKISSTVISGIILYAINQFLGGILVAILFFGVRSIDFSVSGDTIIFLIISGFYLVLTLLYYLGVNYLIKNKLNLE